MNRSALEVERWVLELLIVLKQESEALTQVETWLSQLQEKVIQQDESALDALLKDIRAKQDWVPGLETRRQSIRQQLATILGFQCEQLTLTLLETVLEGELQNQVSCMKAKLQVQTRELDVQRQGTVAFLADCARFNRMLLNSVFGHAQESMTTYSSRGNAKHQRASSLVNMQF